MAPSSRANYPKPKYMKFYYLNYHRRERERERQCAERDPANIRETSIQAGPVPKQREAHSTVRMSINGFII